jgi:hypothetical protein
MNSIGFSTGSIDKKNVCAAVERILQRNYTDAIELSALRLNELTPLAEAIPLLNLERFAHIAVHAPSAYEAGDEATVSTILHGFALRGWLVVLHPDVIIDYSCWSRFGDRLCIENMDRRKQTGRTVSELQTVFNNLPEASFCLDVAHAMQLDTTMTEAYNLIKAFSHRLMQIHISELDANGRHIRLSSSGSNALKEVCGLLASDIPAIIEAPVKVCEMEAEIDASLNALCRYACSSV